MKKKKILIAGIIIAIGIAIYLINNGSMLLSGNVEITETNVGFKISGRVIKLLVDEGSIVKAGDTLAELDGAELASLVAQNRASVQEAATRLLELKAGARSQEIEQARANVSAQEADLKKVKQDYERADVLYKNGAISKSQFDAAKTVAYIFHPTMPWTGPEDQQRALEAHGARFEKNVVAGYTVLIEQR